MTYYSASYTGSRQITEDRWIAIHPALNINDDTTIGQIKEWYSKSTNDPMEIIIVELQNIKS